MRIIKLSQEAEFEDLKKVQEFFSTLSNCEPPGRFRVPKGWIARDALSVGEQLIFTYQTIPVFTARAASGIRKNEDEYCESYPVFFQIDLTSLQAVGEHAAVAGLLSRVAKGQGWNRLTDSTQCEAIWTGLR